MSDAVPIMLTGASGFLGSEIARQCVAQRLKVHCTGRSASGPANVSAYVTADLTKPDEVASAIVPSSTLIHCAGLAHQFKPVPDEHFFAVNVDGTRNVVEASLQAGTRHVVLVSSVSVYGGSPEDVIDENAACTPESAYAESKLQAETEARMLAEAANVPLTILRMATIYGEGDPGNVAKLVRAIDRRRFVWVGNGRNLKSLIHVRDAAAACVTAATAEPTPETRIYNVAADPCEMRQIVDCISDSLGKSVLPFAIPAAIPICLAGAAGRVTAADSLPNRVGRTLKKWVANDAYDGTRFCEDFEFTPTIKLSDGIQREADWYRSRVA